MLTVIQGYENMLETGAVDYRIVRCAYRSTDRLSQIIQAVEQLPAWDSKANQ